MLHRYLWPLGLLVLAGAIGMAAWLLYPSHLRLAYVAIAVAQLAAYPGVLWALLLSLGPKGGLRGFERPLAIGSCLATFVAVAYGLPGPAMGLLMPIAEAANDAGRPLPEPELVAMAALAAGAILLALTALLALWRTRVGNASRAR